MYFLFKNNYYLGNLCFILYFEAGVTYEAFVAVVCNQVVGVCVLKQEEVVFIQL